MFETFFGLTILGLIVLPGVSYRTGRERGHQVRQFRGFRETAHLIFPGFAAAFIAVSLFGVYRAITPSHSPDVGLLLREPGEYFRENVPYLLGWMAAIVVASCFGAYHIGKLISSGSKWDPDVPRSSWSEHLVSPFEGHPVYVQCHLIDGSVVAGFVRTFNDSLEETLERDICIRDPEFWGESGREWDTLGSQPIETVIISAAQIRVLTVTYY